MKVKKLSILYQERLDRLGLSPYPLAMRSLLRPFKQDMIYKMNDAFGVELENSVAASLITGLLGVTAIAQVGRTLVNGFLKFIPVVGSVAGSATAVIITEGIGFAYLKVLEYYYNDETGEVDLPDISVIVDLLKSYYKIFYDEQKKLKP